MTSIEADMARSCRGVLDGTKANQAIKKMPDLTLTETIKCIMCHITLYPVYRGTASEDAIEKSPLFRNPIIRSTRLSKS